MIPLKKALSLIVMISFFQTSFVHSMALPTKEQKKGIVRMKDIPEVKTEFTCAISDQMTEVISHYPSLSGLKDKKMMDQSDLSDIIQCVTSADVSVAASIRQKDLQTIIAFSNKDSLPPCWMITKNPYEHYIQFAIAHGERCLVRQNSSLKIPQVTFIFDVREAIITSPTALHALPAAFDHTNSQNSAFKLALLKKRNHPLVSLIPKDILSLIHKREIFEKASAIQARQIEIFLNINSLVDIRSPHTAFAYELDVSKINPEKEQIKRDAEIMVEFKKNLRIALNL